MKTVAIKMPEDLDAKLTALALQQGKSKSTLIRSAIERFLESGETAASGSCLDLARDLVGCVDGPPDLSHNKRYMKGYGT